MTFRKIEKVAPATHTFCIRCEDVWTSEPQQDRVCKRKSEVDMNTILVHSTWLPDLHHNSNAQGGGSMQA